MKRLSECISKLICWRYTSNMKDTILYLVLDEVKIDGNMFHSGVKHGTEAELYNTNIVIV
jgi:hypothetical protein